MTFYGHKFKIALAIVFVFLSGVDLFLMHCYGFVGQPLIALYVLLGVVAVCALIAIIGNFAPSIVISNNTIQTNGIYDERSLIARNNMNTFTTIHLDEVQMCEITEKAIVLTTKWGSKRILFLSAFSSKQIANIKKEIDKRLSV